jgi:hypothetical protein
MDNCTEWDGHRNKQGYGVTTNHKLAHRQAWEDANGPIPPGVVIRHRCDNPPCIRLSHLEPGTRPQNSEDMVSRGRSQKGEDHTQHKLTEQQVRTILGSSKPGAVLAAHYGVTPHHIAKLRRREEWGHLDVTVAPYPDQRKRGEDNGNARLTADQVRAIRASSERHVDLAATYGVTALTIRNIRKGKTWAWLAD